MGYQRKSRVDIHLSSWRLTSTLLLFALIFPAFTVGSLFCNFCPLMPKTEPCSVLNTECLPNHGCASSWGWQGFRHVLSSQGCLDIQLCNSQEVVKYRGQRYDLTHSCCCGNKCNVTPKVNASLIVSLWFKTSPDNLLSALMKTLQSPCSNQTASSSDSKS
ncbi:sperm acrosome membrane-associated protein 4-like [Poecilia reticulata]|uniref:sperm acrosome membrane-associated protein 4-like n=1 Tax=Poecilia reticulata TaxID=8081 RepID=UPI0004A3BD59|nr:PREDICTED: sperm acrosome membrane-associated protein 4-like [Poecilia reticulata]